LGQQGAKSEGAAWGRGGERRPGTTAVCGV